jgi:hypothetical protein
VARGADEAQQVGALERGRGVVHERVAVDEIVREQLGVEHVGDAAIRVVDDRERRDAAGLHA